MNEDRRLAHLLGQSLPQFVLNIRDDDASSCRDEPAHGRLADSGRAAGDQLRPYLPESPCVLPRVQQDQ